MINLFSSWNQFGIRTGQDSDFGCCKFFKWKPFQETVWGPTNAAEVDAKTHVSLQNVFCGLQFWLWLTARTENNSPIHQWVRLSASWGEIVSRQNGILKVHCFKLALVWLHCLWPFTFTILLGRWFPPPPLLLSLDILSRSCRRLLSFLFGWISCCLIVRSRGCTFRQSSHGPDQKMNANAKNWFCRWSSCCSCSIHAMYSWGFPIQRGLRMKFIYFEKGCLCQ